ncbi:hypothetical protein BHS06_22145 [Myxococcus xanthus]|uniref:hypothetical protein n=1 Tax=Myxococcus xanthus TaxID=34 RepID=UPI0011293BBF|nr:hypothetical protein [Myxococcus xanthus]QDE91463.1 hypothetical protein BHS06_22145 [Myxococcus xanthus]
MDTRVSCPFPSLSEKTTVKGAPVDAPGSVSSLLVFGNTQATGRSTSTWLGATHRAVGGGTLRPGRRNQVLTEIPSWVRA